MKKTTGADLDQLPRTINAVLHYYRFDIGNESDAIKYAELCASLKAKGLKLFDGVSTDAYKHNQTHIKPLDGQTVTLETTYLFNNQWNTTTTPSSAQGLRVFDWCEDIYPNKKIKEGHWLEPTLEMKEARENVFTCGYCGAAYYKPEQTFCSCCLGSEYLKESELYLLQLKPIAFKGNRKQVDIPDDMLTQYKEQQKTARTERLNDSRADKLKSLRQEIRDAELEYRFFDAIIQMDIDFNNLIYYKHTKTFCFGWRDQLSEIDAKQLEKKLLSSHIREMFLGHKIEIKGYTIMGG